MFSFENTPTRLPPPPREVHGGDKSIHQDASKGGTIYYINYQYTAGGRLYTNSESVGARIYAAVSHPEDVESGE